VIEIRLHGRGGQGAVTASRIIATAAYEEGKYSQAIPMYGTERRGAPLTAYVTDTRRCGDGTLGISGLTR
jgi:pyruvate ferredoxin oxidoreductase gamma subunit